MLNYTSLFDDLDELFKKAGRDPVSFRRLAREVQRVSEDLDEYYFEVATDYVIRLEQRLNQPDAQLSTEEATLLRAYLGLPPKDRERDARLVNDLTQLEQRVTDALELKSRPLSLKNLDALRRLLDGMKAILPSIIRALDERQRAQEFEEAVGDGGAGMNRQWLVNAVRRALEGSDAGTVSSDELRFGG